ncbi:hypothetical protein ACFCWY_02680 [Streptomyces sp. NPDC056362]|uniref:hypothetical protein n=1 Tax=unclassified Streptomyces TaxID=2593676 RepID=UPI0035DB8F04
MWWARPRYPTLEKRDHTALQSSAIRWTVSGAAGTTFPPVTAAPNAAPAQVDDEVEG